MNVRFDPNRGALAAQLNRHEHVHHGPRAEQQEAGGNLNLGHNGGDSFSMNDPQTQARILATLQAMLGKQPMMNQGGFDPTALAALPNEPGRDLGAMQPMQQQPRGARRARRSQRSPQSRRARTARSAQRRTTGRTGGPRTQGEQGIPNGLRPNAAEGAREARRLGFTGTIGGIGQRSGPSDHPHGNAIDIMTHNNRQQGRQLAEHYRQNRDRLGVKYVIFEQMIASPRTGWQWQRMPDRGNPTANHLDHVHVSFH